MSKAKLFSIFFLLTSMSMLAQESINDYKYIVVPSQYGFQKAEDSFQLNSLTKFLFNKAGFTAILSTDDFPNDLASDRCLALTAKLKKKSSMFSTKMNFDLVNCKNVVVFSTNEATSKEKEYKRAYQEVVRKTFEDIKAKNYKFSPKEEIVEVLTEKNNETKKVEEAVNNTEVEDSSISVVVSLATMKNSENSNNTKSTNLLYAQSIENGFQLVDSTPKRVYIIKETSVKNVYILNDKNGIMYKHNNDWIVEYYLENQLVRKKLNIKF